MNIYIGWLFKLIPLIMGLICIALGGFVLESSGQSEYFVAGHVLISLAAICLALFTTAFIIISQLTRGVNTFLCRDIKVVSFNLKKTLKL
ncbi:inner membrane protein [Escherichia coli]|nr:inner membrane protein [Escherichia coli]